MRASARPAGQPQRTKLRMSEAHHGHGGRNQNGTCPRRMSTQHQSWLPVPPNPVFILLTVTKAIYLFHLERTLCSGHFSLECSVAFFHLTLPGMCVPHWPLRWVMFVMCPHVGTGGPLCGPLSLQFPGALLLSA